MNNKNDFSSFWYEHAVRVQVLENHSLPICAFKAQNMKLHTDGSGDWKPTITEYSPFFYMGSLPMWRGEKLIPAYDI